MRSTYEKSTVTTITTHDPTRLDLSVIYKGKRRSSRLLKSESRRYSKAIEEHPMFRRRPPEMKAANRFSDDSRHSVKQPTSGRGYRCSVCNRTLRRRYNLKMHLKTHESNQTRPYSCPKDCRRTFSRKEDSEQPADTHTNAPNFRCLLCDMTFRR